MKRMLSLLLALVMLTGPLLQGALAAEPAETTEPVEATEPEEATAPVETTVPEEATEPVETTAPEDATEPEAAPTPGEDIGTGTPDGTPPVLKNLSLSAATVTSPAEIEVVVDASDDVSGLDHAKVIFCCADTGKSIEFGCSSYYYDPDLQRVPYPDGKLHGITLIDKYLPSGSYVIESVIIVDRAGNSREYARTNDRGQDLLPDDLKQLCIQVQGTDQTDVAPPVLHSVRFSEDTVQAPGSLDIILDIRDDISGLDHVGLTLYCPETGRTFYSGFYNAYHDPETGEVTTYPDGEKSFEIHISEFEPGGIYYVKDVLLVDLAGNSVCYARVPSEYTDALPLPNDVQYEVIETDTPDGSGPLLQGLTVSSAGVTAPGSVDITLDATDDVSGLSTARVRFFCDTTQKNLYANCDLEYYDPDRGAFVKYEDGKLHGTLEIDQYVETGTFLVSSVTLIDFIGNQRRYSIYSDDAPLPDAVAAIRLEVFNTVPDVTTSVSKSDFADVVEDAADDAYIAADYSGDATMPKAAFEAIAGTNKTIDLISEGITWRFEGSDITEEVKDIDLKVDIQKVEDDPSASGDAIENELNGDPGVVMKFPENGTLPGKATIQVKVDYAMRQYLGSDTGLSVYYYNNQTGELELVASDLKVINDTYVEFSITHCSYYVLTTGSQADEPTEPTTPEETTPGDSPEPTTPEVPTEPEEVLSGKCGSALSWEFDRSSGVLTISGKGSTISNYTADKAAPWRDFAADITSISFSDSITHIGDYAFAGCTGLTSVVLPGESYVYLGKAAFSGCTNLKEITFISGICYPISGDTFAGVTANVYFPAGYSWSESSQKQFGENLTWAEYGEDAVMLSFYSAYLKAGETYTSTVEAHPAKATADCTFTVDNPSVLQIVSHDQKSVTYKGVKPGRTTVTVTDQNTGLSVSREILVYDSKEITLPYTERALVDAEPCVRSYTVTPTETAKYVLTMTDINAPGWDSSGFSTSCDGENVPVLNWYWGEGIIRQIVELTAGKTYEIRASSLHPELGMTATIEFRKAGTEMKSIKLSADVVAAEVSEDDLEWIGVMTYPLDSYVDRRDIQWSIKDTSIAEIVESTEIECGFRANKAGTTEITVSLNGFTDTATIHVYDAPAIRLGETLELNQFGEIYFQNITFIPEEDGRYVFTVNSDGLRVPNIGHSSASGEVYYGYGEHYRTLSVKLKAGEVFDVEVYGCSFNGTSTITVNKATDTVKSMNLVCTYNTPDRVEFGVQFTPATAAENVVKWEVSDPNLMGHSRGDGDPHNNLAYYTPYGTGKVTVTATSESGKTASCTLMVGQCLNGHSYSDFSPMLDGFGNPTGEEYRTCYRCDTIEQRHIRPATTSGTCGDNLTWSYSGGTLTISGTGAMDDQGIGTAPWVSHQNDIQSVLIQEGVTYVGAYAFYGLPDLTRVSIPLSVTAMGDQAFSDSPVEDSSYPGAPSQWEAIARNDSGPWNTIVHCGRPGADLSYQFDKKSGQLTISGTGPMDSFNNRYPAPWEAYLDAVVSVVIEEGVTTVDAGAFTDLSVLKTVEIPTTVTEIPEGIFYGCGQLVSITVAPGNGDYLSEDGILFSKDKTVLLKYPAGKTDAVYSIPDTVTTIGQSSFARSGSLSYVEIPDSVTQIGHWAFENCTRLGSVRIPDSVTQIGPSAFISCTGLREVTIGSGIRDLDICVFANCISLTEVDLPDTLINIWECTFEGCSSLQRIVLPSGMNFISDAAFADCTALEEIVIGGVKEIYFPFANCDALKKVVFQSDAPTYCTDAFQTLTLTAYYPAGNATWTDAKRASFGGNVTWIPIAYSGICGDDLIWEYDAGTLTISGTGDMYDYSQDQTDPAPWNLLAGDITKVVIEEGATSVGNYAFYNCDDLSDVFIPQSLTKIGNYGLRGRLYINQTVRQWYTVEMGAHDAYFPHWNGGAAFRNDAPIVASGISGERVFWELNENGTMEFFGTGDMYEFWATASPYYELPIKAVVIGEGITNIGMNIFEVMETDPLAQTLESVTIASTVKRIETTAFAHCKALKTITFVGDAPSFGGDCFGDVTATAYYPAGNATWTAALMQDYEGDITWVPYCLEHSFGEWVTEGNTSSRTCTLCGHTEHKVTTESGDVEIQIPQQPDLEVEVDPVLPSEDGYVLVEEAFENADDAAREILKVFDIDLKNKDGVHVQPNGTVKVKLPLDWDRDGNYKVYRVNEDGTLTDMQAYRQGSHMVFETDHFSLYVIAEGPQYGAAVMTGGGRTEYETLDQALQMAPAGTAVQLLKDAQSAVVLIPEDVELDLNGYVLTAGYVASFGDMADRSQGNTGLLKVDKTRFLIQRDNCQLPVWDQDGCRFVEVRRFNQKLYTETTKFCFQPVLEAASHVPILRGSEQSGVTILVRVSWKTEQGARSQDFLYGDQLVSGFLRSYKDTGRYGSMFTLTLKGTEQISDLTFRIVVRSEAGVELLSEPVVRPGTIGN